MKNLFFLLLALIICSATFSQKVKLERHGMIWYEVPPTDNSLQAFNSMFVRTTVENIPNFEVEQMFKDQAIQAVDKYFGKFEKKESQEAADFMVTVHFEEFHISKPKVKSSQTKSGEKTITQYSYMSEMNYKIILIIEDKAGKEFWKTTSFRKDPVVGPAQSSKDMAKMKFDSELKSAKKERFKSFVNEQIKSAADKYCFVKEGLLIQFGRIKPKKYEYDEINACFDKFKRIAEIQTVDGHLMTEELDQLCQEIIQTMTKELAEAEIDNKKARINKDVDAVLHYHIAMAEFALQSYEKALEHFNKAKSINGEKLCHGHTAWIMATEKMIAGK